MNITKLAVSTLGALAVAFAVFSASDRVARAQDANKDASEKPSSNFWEVAPKDVVDNGTPAIEKEILFEIGVSKGNPRNSEGDYIRLKNGDLFYVYSYFYNDNDRDDGAARLAGVVSKDDGKTWSDEPQVALENEGKINVMSVSLLRLSNGAIALVYLVKDAPADCRPYLRFSYDEAKTWTDRVELISEPVYYVVNNARVVQLSTGRVLVPIAWHHTRENGVDVEDRAEAFCLYSDDEGKTWNRSASVANPNNEVFQEPGVVELASGDILMTIRNMSGRQIFAYSNDKGETWSDPEPSPLVSPRSPASIARIPGSEELIAVWNDAPNMRNPLTVGILSADGRAVLHKKTLDQAAPGVKQAFSYPALLLEDEKTLNVAYCAGIGDWWGLNGIKLVRVKIDDIRK